MSITGPENSSNLLGADRLVDQLQDAPKILFDRAPGRVVGDVLFVAPGAAGITEETFFKPSGCHPPRRSGMEPVGRMGEIRDIVEAVLFLENASFVTGEILHVDGGQAAGHW